MEIKILMVYELYLNLIQINNVKYNIGLKNKDKIMELLFSTSILSLIHYL